jgi:hypothetical protein
MDYLECLFYFIVAIIILEVYVELCKWIGRLNSPNDWEVPSYVHWDNRY